MSPVVPPVLALLALLAAPPELELREVVPGVYAVLQPAAGRFDDANSAVVIGERGVIVVDAQVSPLGARAVLARVRELTPLPVETLILTHWHSDHVQGASVYREAFPGLRIIAHRHTRDDITARAIPDHATELEELPQWLAAAEAQLASGQRRDGGELSDEQRAQLAGAVERRRAHLERIAEVRFELPDAVFDERLTLHRGDFELQLRHVAGHTRGDLVVFLPRQKLLVSGDILDDLPFTGHGSPSALVATLRSLEGLDFEQLIPGHGSLRQGKRHLRQVAELFESLVEQASAARAAGHSLEATRDSVDVSRFRDHFVTDAASERYWGFFIGEAIARAWEEAGAGR